MRLPIDQRAEDEIAVVADCVQDYEQRGAQTEDQIKKMELERDSLNALIHAKIGGRAINTIPPEQLDELDDLQDRLETLEATIEDHRALLSQFRRSANLLDSLHKTLITFYQRGDYKFVIKNIPEKKLPKLVGDVNKISTVIQLLERLEKKFHEENARILAKIERSRQRRQHEREVNRQRRGMERTSNNNRLERRYGMASATAETPIDVTAPNTNTNPTNTNNA